MKTSGKDQGDPLNCALTKTLLDMDFSSVSDLFAENGTGAPAVLWNPSIYDLSHLVIKGFSEFMRAEDGLAKWAKKGDVDDLDIHPFSPWVMVLEPVPEQSDFRYLKYGTEIAAMFGRDMTGHCTSEIGGHISDFFVALYAAVIIRKQSVLSVHEPPSGVFATVWRRLIYPLLDENGEVHMIAAVNVPDNELSAGLEALPDPALVTRQDGVLMYANASARRLFGEPVLPRGHISDYCDMNIELPADAEGFARAEGLNISQTMGSRNQVLVHFELLTSATFFRGLQYYIVQMKPN
ncbi:MAG: hypothetical protein AAF601_08595 [Pseudomonadota bacterium]